MKNLKIFVLTLGMVLVLCNCNKNQTNESTIIDSQTTIQNAANDDSAIEQINTSEDNAVDMSIEKDDSQPAAGGIKKTSLGQSGSFEYSAYGSYKIDGKLDGTYPFAMNVWIEDGSVTGTYYAQAARTKKAGIIYGSVIGNELNIYVETGNKLTRTFEGIVSGTTYSGRFKSGYDGKRRRFTAKIRG